LCATSEHGQAVGSAAEVGEDPTQRATFELLERIALLEAVRASEREFPLRSASGKELGGALLQQVFPPSDAPDQWAFARSSGVSLHTDWTSACEGAARELLERDRVLRAWMGQTLAVRIPNGAASSMFSDTPSYDWRTYLFPAGDAPVSGSDVEVVGVFGFPKAPHMPLVFGYGARSDRSGALLSAQKEALQLLAFLWGESIPDVAPDPVPAPMTHLETYQVRDRHETLLRWLEEGHAAHYRPLPAAAADDSLRYADLTPSWLAGRCHVARALCPAAISLAFGRSPLLAHLPSHLRIHPIP
jgi:ribosomal protein S12 methylthiotransferase accessory factor YcaO